jgi:hypothetical protein
MHSDNILFSPENLLWHGGENGAKCLHFADIFGRKKQKSRPERSAFVNINEYIFYKFL